MLRFAGVMLEKRLLIFRSVSGTIANIVEDEVNVSLLREVVEEHSKNGKSFLLPFADTEAINRILSPLKSLQNQGVLVEFIKDAMITSPDLFKAFSKTGDKCWEMLNLLVDMCGFTYEDALRFYAEHASDLALTDAGDAADRLSVFSRRGFQSGRMLGSLLKKCPQLLYVDSPNQMSIRLEKLANFFSTQNIDEMLERFPQIVFIPFEELELKYEYIYFYMNIEPENLAKSIGWLGLSIDQIMERHEFMRRTGKYVTPDPKRPQFEKDNPPATSIFDFNERDFVRWVVGVTIEEWNVFKELSAKQRELQERDRPFERIKPSQRKAFERRRKEAMAADEYVLE